MPPKTARTPRTAWAVRAAKTPVGAPGKRSKWHRARAKNAVQKAARGVAEQDLRDMIRDVPNMPLSQLLLVIKKAR
jgi:hypothetical protein